MTEDEAKKQLVAAVNEVLGRALFRPKIVFRNGRVQVVDNALQEESDVRICGLTRAMVMEGLTAKEWTNATRKIYYVVNAHERSKTNEERNPDTHGKRVQPAARRSTAAQTHTEKHDELLPKLLNHPVDA